jgi:hypothetical protein
MSDVTAITAPFVAAAAAAGVRPPVRILGHDTRGWSLFARSGDVLVLDEFGELWWTRQPSPTDARPIRTCWPEEARSLATRIAQVLAAR